MLFFVKESPKKFLSTEITGLLRRYERWGHYKLFSIKIVPIEVTIDQLKLSF